LSFDVFFEVHEFVRREVIVGIKLLEGIEVVDDDVTRRVYNINNVSVTLIGV